MTAEAPPPPLPTTTSTTQPINTLSPPPKNHSSKNKNNICGSQSPTDIRSFPHQPHGVDNVYDEEEEQTSLSYSEEYDSKITMDDEDQFNNSLSLLGELPIVNENSTLDEEEDNEILMMSHNSIHLHDDDEDNHNDDLPVGEHIDDELSDPEYEEDIRNSYLEYQMEQEELQREMNVTKIAFAAYRNAVLHLVHNQTSFHNHHKKKKASSDDPKKNPNDDDIVEDGEHPNYDSETMQQHTNINHTEEDANARMNMIEDIAKEIIETKAKACMEAVEVVKEFNLRREEKRQRSKMLVGGLAGVGGEDTILMEFRKMKNQRNRMSPNVSVSNSEATDRDVMDEKMDTTQAQTPENLEKKMVKSTSVSVKSSMPKTTSTTTTATITNNTQQTKNIPVISKPKSKISFSMPTGIPSLRKEQPQPVGPIVRLKQKPTRHVDCIKHTLPKFEFKNLTKDHDGTNKDEDSSLPARYGTSSWIKNMAVWRIEKMKHEEDMLQRCGCPDCMVDLAKLKEKKVASRAC